MWGGGAGAPLDPPLDQPLHARRWRGSHDRTDHHHRTLKVFCDHHRISKLSGSTHEVLLSLKLLVPFPQILQTLNHSFSRQLDIYDPFVRPGTAGLLIGIECSRVRNSSWMYLTSLVNYPNRRRTSYSIKETTRSCCSRTPTVLGLDFPYNLVPPDI